MVMYGLCIDLSVSSPQSKCFTCVFVFHYVRLHTCYCVPTLLRLWVRFIRRSACVRMLCVQLPCYHTSATGFSHVLEGFIISTAKVDTCIESLAAPVMCYATLAMRIFLSELAQLPLVPACCEQGLLCSEGQD